MNTDRWRARIVGILFIVAAAASIAGLLSYDPALNHPAYVTGGPTSGPQIVMGALWEMITAVSVAGTAIALFPVLKRQNESVALGYVCFRVLEAVLIVIGLVSMLSLLSLRQDFAGAVVTDVPALLVSSRVLLAIHAWTFILGPNLLLGLNTLLCSALLFRSRLVPRFIASMGLTGALSITVAAVLELFGVFAQTSLSGILLALPVASYEMTLAVYLILRGFHVPALQALTPRTPMARLADA